MIAEATKFLARLGAVREAPAVDLEAIRAAQEQAELAMWGWYLEWSTIARSVIKDGRLLQQLGFVKARRGPEEPETVEPIADPSDPTPA